MNKIILSVALSAITVSAPVLAQTGQYSTTPVVAKQVVANPVDTPVSTTLQATANQPVDISFVFKDGQNLQVKDMTQTEMEETQGAWLPLAIIGGAATSMWTEHAISYARSGEPASLKDVSVSGVVGGLGGLAGSRIHHMYKAGKEIKIGNDIRIAPFGNRTGKPHGELPHYHRRVKDPDTGATYKGQGIGRHRPWDTSTHDKSWKDRF